MMSRFILHLRLADSNMFDDSLPSISDDGGLRFRRPSLLGNIGAPLGIDGENEHEYDWIDSEGDEWLADEEEVECATPESDTFEIARRKGGSEDGEGLLRGVDGPAGPSGTLDPTEWRYTLAASEESD